MNTDAPTWLGMLAYGSDVMGVVCIVEGGGVPTASPGLLLVIGKEPGIEPPPGALKCPPYWGFKIWDGGMFPRIDPVFPGATSGSDTCPMNCAMLLLPDTSMTAGADVVTSETLAWGRNSTCANGNSGLGSEVRPWAWYNRSFNTALLDCTTREGHKKNK